MTTYRLNEHAPQIASDAWIAPGARVVGRACLEPASSVWFGAVIGRECLVAAGALVTEGKVFPDCSLILGAPAKAVRQLSDEEVAALRHSAADYVVRATRYRHGLEGLD
jgi:carbonic anhydrase/acetyltransferase-like protein (isoleucine patch superfamily)